MRGQIHRVTLIRNMVADVPFAFQYDVGQILLPSASDLPYSYEVHFSNEEFHGTAKKQLGTAEGCLIPDEYLQSGEPVYMWIYIPSQDHGETEYKMRMQIKKRSKATDVQPTPQEVSVIDEYIAALNTGVSAAEGYAQNASNSAAAALESERKAKASEDAAKLSETASNQAALRAAASATLAGQKATAADQSATAASQSADAAHRSEVNAAGSADRAEQGAAAAGWMVCYIENGDLILERTTNCVVDFYLEDGDLIMEAVQ